MDKESIMVYRFNEGIRTMKLGDIVSTHFPLTKSNDEFSTASFAFGKITRIFHHSGIDRDVVEITAIRIKKGKRTPVLYGYEVCLPQRLFPTPQRLG